jgi:hypothetical protein
MWNLLCSRGTSGHGCAAPAGGVWFAISTGQPRSSLLVFIGINPLEFVRNETSGAPYQGGNLLAGQTEPFFNRFNVICSTMPRRFR